MLATEVNWWTYTQGVLTLIVALVAAAVAYLSWLTNQHKLRLDLYDRRLKLCQRLRRLSREGAYEENGNEKANALWDLAINFRFLFGKEAEMKIEDIARDVSTVCDFRYFYNEDKKQPALRGKPGKTDSEIKRRSRWRRKFSALCQPISRLSQRRLQKDAGSYAGGVVVERPLASARRRHGADTQDLATLRGWY